MYAHEKRIHVFQVTLCFSYVRRCKGLKYSGNLCFSELLSCRREVALRCKGVFHICVLHRRTRARSCLLSCLRRLSPMLARIGTHAHKQARSLASTKPTAHWCYYGPYRRRGTSRCYCYHNSSAGSAACLRKHGRHKQTVYVTPHARTKPGVPARAVNCICVYKRGTR